jgi:hypothetical protein
MSASKQDSIRVSVRNLHTMYSLVAVIGLLDDGGTVNLIARYGNEA